MYHADVDIANHPFRVSSPLQRSLSAEDHQSASPGDLSNDRYIDAEGGVADASHHTDLEVDFDATEALSGQTSKVDGDHDDDDLRTTIGGLSLGSEDMLGQE